MKKFLTSTFAFAVLLLLLSAGVYAGLEFLLGNTETELSSTQTKIHDKKIEVAKAESARSIAGTLDASEALVSSHFISRDYIVDYLESAQKGGKALGSDVNIVSVSDLNAGQYPRVAISLLVSGSFDSVMRVIGTAENSPYDTSVSSLTLDLETSDAKKGHIWNAATVLSVGLTPLATSTPKKP